jgi:hypothetical protein
MFIECSISLFLTFKLFLHGAQNCSIAFVNQNEKIAIQNENRASQVRISRLRQRYLQQATTDTRPINMRLRRSK